MREKRDYDFKMPEADMEIKISSEPPLHPSRFFLEFLKKAGLDEEPANKLAKILGVSRSGYYDFLNEETGISPDMSVRLARFFLDFDPAEYPYASNPYYWWDLNNKWLFVNSIKNPKNSLKRNAIGLIRYFVRGNEIREIDDRRGEISLNDGISLSFKEIPEESKKNKPQYMNSGRHSAPMEFN